MAFVITEDKIEDGRLVGRVFGKLLHGPTTEEMLKNHPDRVHFRLYDDDGELYYAGFYVGPDDDRMFEPLDWAMDFAGCTEMKVRDAKTGKYDTI